MGCGYDVGGHLSRTAGLVDQPVFRQCGGNDHGGHSLRDQGRGTLTQFIDTGHIDLIGRPVQKLCDLIGVRCDACHLRIFPGALHPVIYVIAVGILHLLPAKL